MKSLLKTTLLWVALSSLTANAAQIQNCKHVNSTEESAKAPAQDSDRWISGTQFFLEAGKYAWIKCDFKIDETTDIANDWVLDLGQVDFWEETFLEDVKIGSTFPKNIMNSSRWVRTTHRAYEIPAYRPNQGGVASLFVHLFVDRHTDIKLEENYPRIIRIETSRWPTSPELLPSVMFGLFLVVLYSIRQKKIIQNHDFNRLVAFGAATFLLSLFNSFYFYRSCYSIAVFVVKLHAVVLGLAICTALSVAEGLLGREAGRASIFLRIALTVFPLALPGFGTNMRQATSVLYSIVPICFLGVIAVRSLFSDAISAWRRSAEPFYLAFITSGALILGGGAFDLFVMYTSRPVEVMVSGIGFMAFFVTALFGRLLMSKEEQIFGLENDLERSMRKNSWKCQPSPKDLHSIRKLLHDLKPIVGAMASVGSRLKKSEEGILLETAVMRTREILRELGNVLSEEESTTPDHRDLIKETINILRAANENASVSIDFSTSLKGRWFAPGFSALDLQRVLTNLIENAVNACTKTKNARIDVVLDYTDSSSVKLVVADNGSGMSKYIRSNAFEVAASVGNVSGSGLGLAIVQDICKKSGATVSIESKQGAGTTIVVFFVGEDNLHSH